MGIRGKPEYRVEVVRKSLEREDLERGSYKERDNLTERESEI